MPPPQQFCTVASSMRMLRAQATRMPLLVAYCWTVTLVTLSLLPSQMPPRTVTSSISAVLVPAIDSRFSAVALPAARLIVAPVASMVCPVCGVRAAFR
jgi:hypothetical protein